jgi:cation transport ATPase
MVLEKPNIDRMGMWVSAVCFVHCMLPPMLFYSAPFLVYFLYHPWVHPILTLIVVPIGIFGFWHGYREHKNKVILTLGALGILSVSAQQFISYEMAQKIGPTLLLWLGSGLMILAHYLNFRQRRQRSSLHLGAH